MPARLPYMQFYPADWCRDTFKLSLAARGAWIDLCCHMWTSDTGEETNTIPEWSRLLRSTEAETMEVLTALIETGVASGVRESGPSGSGRVTIRCRRIFNEKAERERKRTWKAGRDGSGKVAEPVAAPFQTHSEQNRAEQSQNKADQNRTDNTLATPPGKPAGRVRKVNQLEPYSPEFEKFWTDFPVVNQSPKGSKGEAWEQWKTVTALLVLGRGDSPAAVAELLTKAAKDRRGMPAEGSDIHTKHVCRWLKCRCWESDPPPAAGAPTARQEPRPALWRPSEAEIAASAAEMKAAQDKLRPELNQNPEELPL